MSCRKLWIKMATADSSPLQSHLCPNHLYIMRWGFISDTTPNAVAPHLSISLYCQLATTHCISSSASFFLPSSPKFWMITCLFMFSMVYGSHHPATCLLLPLLSLVLIVDPHDLDAQTHHHVVLAGGNDVIIDMLTSNQTSMEPPHCFKMFISCCSKQTGYLTVLYEFITVLKSVVETVERGMCRRRFIAVITSFRGSFLHAVRMRNMWRGSRRWFVCVVCSESFVDCHSLIPGPWQNNVPLSIFDFIS